MAVKMAIVCFAVHCIERITFFSIHEAMRDSNLPQRSSDDEPWGAAAPREHVVQFYAEERTLLDTLERYSAGGLAGGESVILIATRTHLDETAARLGRAGICVERAGAEHRYIARDAEDLLSHLMVRGRIDEARFQIIARQMLSHAFAGAPRVRGFGEMVSLVWQQGLRGAALRLEELWHELVRRRPFPVVCAYHQRVLGESAEDAMRDIRARHTREIGGPEA